MTNRPAGGARSKRWERALDISEPDLIRLLGKAGEHIVCADLYMHGWVANVAAEGRSYDIIAERGGRMFRIAVKTTREPRPRRLGAREAYKFDVCRRLPQVLRHRKRYTRANVDVVALVALDTLQVAYIAVDDCPVLIWLVADDALPSKHKFGPKFSNMRKFSDLTLLEATKW